MATTLYRNMPYKDDTSVREFKENGHTEYYVSFDDLYDLRFRGLKIVEAYIYRYADQHYSSESELKSLLVDSDGPYHGAYLKALNALKEYRKNPAKYDADYKKRVAYNQRAWNVNLDLEARAERSLSNPTLGSKAKAFKKIGSQPYIIEYIRREYDSPESFGGYEGAQTLTQARMKGYDTLWHWGDRPKAKIYKRTSKGYSLEGVCANNSNREYGYTPWTYLWITKEGKFRLFESGKIGQTKL